MKEWDSLIFEGTKTEMIAPNEKRKHNLLRCVKFSQNWMPYSDLGGKWKLAGKTYVTGGGIKQSDLNWTILFEQYLLWRCRLTVNIWFVWIILEMEPVDNKLPVANDVEDGAPSDNQLSLLPSVNWERRAKTLELELSQLRPLAVQNRRLRRCVGGVRVLGQWTTIIEHKMKSQTLGI